MNGHTFRAKGRAYLTLTKIKSRFSRRRLVLTAAGVLMVAGSAVAVAPAANAATVFNRLYCDINTGKCYQVNGAHNSSVGNQCFWQYGGTANDPNRYTVNDCNSWGSPIWQNHP